MLKILRSKKSSLEIWWTGTFPQHLVLIHLTVSGEKGHLRDDSNSAVQYHKAKLKTRNCIFFFFCILL